MLTRRDLINFVSWPGIFSIALLMLVIIPLITLIGCSEHGEGGPVISSPSNTAGQKEDPSSNPVSVSLSSNGLPPRSDSPDEVPMVTVTSTSKGATVRLNWQQSSDVNIFGYYVYYGKQPAQDSGSCSSYEANQAVDAPPATITGLEPDTLYFFAIKKFNESESSCSNEVMVFTPPAPTGNG